MFRVVAWNIRAGGGRRVEGILRQLADWNADVVVLSEFRGSDPSTWLAQQLNLLGLSYQRRAQNVTKATQNQVFVASRHPVRLVSTRFAPTEPARWLMMTVDAPVRFSLAAMHIPNQVSGRKQDYHQAVLEIARRWRRKPTVMIGDTNSGQIDLDEESPVFNEQTDQWFRDLSGFGWVDAFRFKHGNAREYTWYSPNKGNGFRLDQAFLSKIMSNNLSAVTHVWGRDSHFPDRRDSLSDHAALLRSPLYGLFELVSAPAIGAVNDCTGLS